MTARRRRLAACLRAAEALLLIIAVVAFGWFAGARLAAGKEQAALARELERRIPATPLPAAAEAKPAARHVAPGAVVARIEIPRLGLRAIAREGADTETLATAVGHVPRTAWPGEPGNAAFAAHRDTFFRPLRHIRAGDVVALVDERGRHEYVVESTRVVTPEDVWVLDPTEEATLTLVTCHPFNFVGSAPNRFIVRARLKSD